VKINFRKKKKIILISIIVILILVGLFNIFKPLPIGVSSSGEIFKVPNDSVTFISDLTFFDNTIDDRIMEQGIFDEVFAMIKNAEKYILIDMFLFNDFQGKENVSFRKLSSELTEILIQKKIDNPEINIIFITDPINSIYGYFENQNINKLLDVNIQVVNTNLKKLRDSNPLYSSIYRPFLQFLPVGLIKLPNPFTNDGSRVSLKAYFTLLNFKANHRKIIVTDYIDINGDLKMSSLVTSANPHDGSSAHSNVAIKINDYIWKDILKSEYAVIDFSDYAILYPDYKLYKDEEGDVEVQILTEKKIQTSLLNSINKTESGDSIDVMMFYLSDREVVKSLKMAQARGVNVKVILDPNKDAFGRKKNGVPNVAVAREFKKNSNDFQLRWCNTHGEQCHSKLIIISRNDFEEMFIGSANLTKRNIGDYNLETNIKISGKGVSAIKDAKEYFNLAWSDESEKYTTGYDFYKDESLWKYLQYRVMEKTGLSSF
jgi:phosphatidylserine/phosphatidylglycerophosphate/cardiolipin synthase-like enzyme